MIILSVFVFTGLIDNNSTCLIVHERIKSNLILWKKIFTVQKQKQRKTFDFSNKINISLATYINYNNKLVSLGGKLIYMGQIQERRANFQFNY